MTNASSERRSGTRYPYVHASAVVIRESGVLIRGPSGSGKSSLAMALIAGAGSRGQFARLIGDDRVGLESVGGRLIARGHPSIFGQIERRGLGIFRVPHFAAAVVGLVVDLGRDDFAVPRFPELGDDRVILDGVHIPRVSLLIGLAWSDQALLVLEALFMPRAAP
jgi:HPr kinase/phosphorylase